jgi:hypothetical protein
MRFMDTYYMSVSIRHSVSMVGWILLTGSHVLVSCVSGACIGGLKNA